MEATGPYSERAVRGPPESNDSHVAIATTYHTIRITRRPRPS
jgi:hypothetical protein